MDYLGCQELKEPKEMMVLEGLMEGLANLETQGKTVYQAFQDKRVTVVNQDFLVWMVGKENREIVDVLVSVVIQDSGP
jgi:hypothetical protein